MRSIEQLAVNKVQSKIYALSLQRRSLHLELAGGITGGVSIEEGYSVVDKITDDIEVYQYILSKITE